MVKMKNFTAAEIAAYNAAHATPHRKIIAAQAAEAKLLPASGFPYGEFPNRHNIGETAEQVLERKMLHGENS